MQGIFTIPPGEDFLKALAKGLWKESVYDPLRLSEALLLLPTRRACRHLQETFSTLAPATLLPRLQPLGGIDEEELYFAPGLELDIPPAIEPLRRLMLLTQLVQKQDTSLSCDQAALLAEALARFLDEAQTARCDMTRLPELVEQKELAQHWQDTVKFLKILTEAWPEILASQGGIDPARRRDLILKKQADVWRANPPPHLVIAAGTTGTVPATADLLAAIVALPQGVIILPGLDCDMAEAAWQEITDTHPQAGMKHLLERLGADRADVKIWPHAKKAAPRALLLQESLLPAQSEPKPNIFPDKISGLGLLTLDHPQEEAQAIALMMRAALETEGKTAALVTPDRGLAARVVELLARWGIEADDSAGTPLLAQPPAGFLAALLRAAAPGADATDYLALMKHPIAAFGLDPAICRAQARELELIHWRTSRPQKSAWLDEVKRTLGVLTSTWFDALPLKSRIEAHIKIAEEVAKSDKESGIARLWAKEAGESTAEWFEEWRAAAEDFPPLSGGDYAALLTGLLRATPFRVPYGRHPRLSIFGPLEARLIRADLVILGGMNEGTWPPEASIDPWMSRPMRAAFGLPSMERRIGLSAHDFVQLASAPEAVLTRARRSGTALAVPSRFLLQLEASLRAQGYGDDALTLKQPWAAWAHGLDEPDTIASCPAPEPKPPTALRPKQLSVTEIGTWRRNPYAIYAKHILKLKKLESLEQDIDASDRGALVHEALEEFIKKFPKQLPEDAESQLLSIGRDIFGRMEEHPEVFALWWPRFERMAAWFIEYERARAKQGILPAAAETSGKITLGAFTLKGRADRIDRMSDGAYAITDYKTGGAPTNAEVKAGLEPQLPLLALIAKQGGFEGLPAAEVASLSYLRLTGAKEAGEALPIKADIAALVEDARNGLLRLIEKFSDVNEPYRAVPEAALAPAYDDYAHLARLAEWGRGRRDE